MKRHITLQQLIRRTVSIKRIYLMVYREDSDLMIVPSDESIHVRKAY